jgi:hypothetical protein
MGSRSDDPRAARRGVYQSVRRQLEELRVEREILYRALNAHLRAANGDDRDYAAEEIAKARRPRVAGREGFEPSRER